MYCDFDEIVGEIQKASFNFNICHWLDRSIFLINKVELKFPQLTIQFWEGVIVDT